MLLSWHFSSFTFASNAVSTCPSHAFGMRRSVLLPVISGLNLCCMHVCLLASMMFRILRGGLTSPLLSPRHDAVILSDEYLSSGEAFSPVASRPASVCGGTPATDGASPLQAREPPTRSPETLPSNPSPPPRARSPAGSSSTGGEAGGHRARVRVGDSAAEAAAAARQAQVDADLLHAARQTPDRCAAGGVEAPGAQPLPQAPGGYGACLFTSRLTGYFADTLNLQVVESGARVSFLSMMMPVCKPSQLVLYRVGLCM